MNVKVKRKDPRKGKAQCKKEFDKQAIGEQAEDNPNKQVISREQK